MTIAGISLTGILFAGCGQGVTPVAPPAASIPVTTPTGPEPSVTPVSPEPINEGTPEATIGVLQTAVPLQLTYPLDSADLNTETVAVQGQTLPGAMVEVNDSAGVADSNGNFSIPVTLDEGLNGIDVIATDDNGAQGEVLIMVNVDSTGNASSGTLPGTAISPTTLPLQVSQPVDGETLTTDSVVVKGQTAPGATVIISDQTATADADGNFNMTVSLTSGPNAIQVTAVDDNGNSNEVTLMVNGA